MRKTVLLLIFVMLSLEPRAQILISLLFGEALNTPNIEFGLSGGLSRSNAYSISNSDGKNNFDLGFYFHIAMKNNSYLSTGVRVKSSVGVTGLSTYEIGDAAFDTVYKNGTLTKNIPIFYVPILFHQRIKERWYIEAGPQLGLIYRPLDIFEVDSYGGDLKYEKGVQDEYKRIDAGFLAGVGYKYSKEVKSVSYGVQYYYGFVNVSKTPNLTIRNNAFYLFVRIPIGL